MDNKLVISLGIAWLFLAVVIGNILYLSAAGNNHVARHAGQSYNFDYPHVEATPTEHAKSRVCVQTAEFSCPVVKKSGSNGAKDAVTTVNIVN